MAKQSKFICEKNLSVCSQNILYLNTLRLNTDSF